MQCPSCASQRCRNEIESDDDGEVTADYWVCETCGHAWSYEHNDEQRQPAAEEQ